MNARNTSRLCTLIATFGLSAAAGFSKVDKLPFGTADGKAVDLYVLTNSSGMTAKIMSYGATITELDTPDRNGRLDDVVLGFDTLQGYLAKEPYFGATVGRVGNRIAKGVFTLNGKTYHLATNDGPNHLHGGNKGFDKVVWNGEVVPGADPSVRFTYLSKEGEEGYPRKLQRRGGLHGHERERAPDRLHGVDRQGHTGERHEPLVLQPRRPRER